MATVAMGLDQFQRFLFRDLGTGLHSCHLGIGLHTLSYFSLSKISAYSSCCKYLEVKSLSHVQLFATPWTVAYQAPLSMGFSRQKYWSGLPLSSPSGNLGPEYGLIDSKRV